MNKLFSKEAVLNKTTNGILFTEEGYKFISKEVWTNNKVSLLFYNIVDTITLCPKYVNDLNYLYISVTNSEIQVSAMINGLHKVYFSTSDFQLAERNELVYESISETKHRFLFNHQELFQFDSSLFIEGMIAIYGRENEAIELCLVEQMQSQAWGTNTNEAGVSVLHKKINGNEMMVLHSMGETPAMVYQDASITTSIYTVSFDYQGTGELLINNQTALSLDTKEMVRESITLPSETSAIQIKFCTNEMLTVGKVQLEESSYSTPYIPNESLTYEAEREGTNLSYPNKEAFFIDEGSLYVKITPLTEWKDHLIFYTDTNEFSLFYKEGSFGWKAYDQEIRVPHAIQANQPIELFVTWSSYEISLSINKKKYTNKSVTAPTQPVNRLIFSNALKERTEPVVLEEWALFKKEFTLENDIEEYLEDASMQSLFDGGINGKNVSWSEIPIAPHDYSPILVEKEDGTPLQKVSFFDPETGDYRTWNKEAFVYDGKRDYVSISFANINEQFSSISIETENGERIGEPYRLEGKRFYFSLSDYEKIIYKNQTLQAVYQVKDSYTIDYNIKALDGYRIDFAAHDGTDRFVFQEGNRFGEPTKLATMIEMNPIQNQNTSGFLYVTNTVNKTEDFRITTTPDRLKADGFSKSTLVIEPLDYQGNFLSHVHLSVKADKGFVCRYIDKAAGEAQKRSGQHLYQYIAPFIHHSENSTYTEDHIRILDEDSQIGVCYKIILGPTDKAHHLQISEAEKVMLTNKSILMNEVIMHESLEGREAPELFDTLDLNQDGKITLDEIDVLSSGERDFELSAIVQKLQKCKEDEKRASTQGFNKKQ